LYVSQEYRLDVEGRALSLTLADVSSGTPDPTESWQRDASGQVTVYTDSLLNSTYYSYDSSGDLTEVDYPDDSFTLYEYDGFFHLVTQETQSLSSGVNSVTAFTYDEETGDLLTETTAYGTSAA